MTRHIDADWIYEKVENRYRISSGIEHRCERDLLDLICEAPTADVVPKSEVAMEIFEEMYGKVASKIEPYIRPIFKGDLGFDAGFRNGKTDALIEVLVLIAELKKKYTEEQV